MPSMTEENPISITIARQFGAGGAVLGQRLARRLEFVYLDRDILRMAAERMGEDDADLKRWDERLPRFWERFIQTLSAGSPEGVYTAGRRLPGVAGRLLFDLESRVIRETAAKRSVVIIGRAGGWVLREHPRLVTVYLHAPISARLPQVMLRLHLASEQEARKMIERVDMERERFVQEVTGRVAGDARNYDLCVNTHHVGLDLAEAMIVRHVEQMRLELPPGSTQGPSAF
jgi:cytidylate kinase